jgi:hypothetical protein
VAVGGVKELPARKTDSLTTICEPRPPRPVIRIALPLYFFFNVSVRVKLLHFVFHFPRNNTCATNCIRLNIFPFPRVIQSPLRLTMRSDACFRISLRTGHAICLKCRLHLPVRAILFDICCKATAIRAILCSSLLFGHNNVIAPDSLNMSRSTGFRDTWSNET